MTKRELQTKMDMENEFYVISFQNMLSTLFVGPVGYSQVKFNKINFAITKDAHDRRPTILVALLCGFFWFTGIPFINILPRFFLGGLLIYAGMFFLELVIVSYQRVTKKEYCIVWLIILINAFTGLPQVTGSLVAPHSLLIAVISGLILAAVGFIYQYARVSVIRDVLSGKDFQSAVVRPFSEQSLVERIGTRYMIIELEGYIFFGSATQVVSMAKFLAEQNVKTPEEGGRPMAESLKYVSIDFAHVENIDYSGAGAFREVREILEDAGCAVLFTSLNSKVRKKLIQEDVIQLPVYGPGQTHTAEGEPCLEFADLDFASEYVEGCLLERAAFVRGYWLLFDSFQKLHTQAVLKANFEIFEAILGTEAGNRLWRYAEKIKFKAGEFLCREGHFNHTLYLLQKGKVTTFVATGGGHLQLQRQAISITVASKNRGALNESDWGLKSKSVSSSGNSDGVESNVKRTGKGMVKTKREISRERSMSHLHSHIKRKHTMGRGAFVNEECLFRDTPVQNSTVADEDCTVWAISRQSMKELEAHDSNLAAAILRNILRVSSAVRERLEREVFAIESYHTTTEDEAVPLLRADTAGSMQNPQQPSSKNLGNRVLKEIRDMHEHHVNDVSDVNLIDDTLHVTGAGSHHLHHFHHMTLDNALHVSGPDIVDEIRNQPPTSPVAASLRASAASTKSRKNGESSLDWHSVRPHLSAAQRQDAIDCFLVHSVLEQNDISGASSGAHPDILPELILAGVAPHVVHAVATKVNNDKAEGQDAADGKSASETPEIRRKKRRGTIDALHELRRPKSLRVVELNSELDAGEVEASEVSLLESIMRAHTNGRSPNMAHRSGDAKAIAEKFARMTSSPVGTPSSTPTSPKRPGSPALRHDLKLGSVHRRLSLEELQRAVMDLGFFPSAAEVRQMHETLGPHHKIRVDSNEFDAGVDLDEFLEMITVLSLKRMTERELHGLHVLFLQHADVENERQDGMQLSREALGKLMKSLNHPEDEVELEFLMREWDLEGRGFLDFDAFVSIVSHVLKSEELDEHIERDFLTLCGETDVKHPSMSQQRCAVVAGDIVRRARELGVVVDHRLAEEMVFDADEDRTGKVSLDELIVTLETVHIDESIDEKYANANTGVAEGGWLGS
jgi:Ca2+-binding EF-hand superfamily protein/CRP-like cAMP-binding protein/anti-anti-sigma regulatory factor